MINHYQTKFHSLVNEIMQEDGASPEFAKYQSVISMIYTLILEGRLDDVDKMIRINFPNYYGSQPPSVFSEN